jgi:hypothetical protein
MYVHTQICHVAAFAASNLLLATVLRALLRHQPAEILWQAELQKLEKKLADALDALKVEQASNERANRRAALDQHRLEQVPSRCRVPHVNEARHIVLRDAWLWSSPMRRPSLAAGISCSSAATRELLQSARPCQAPALLAMCIMCHDHRP